MEIIAALKNGDEIIFRQVFDQFHRKVYASVLSKTGSSWLAEETAQLTFVKLWEYRHSLNGQYALSTQVYRMASTTMIDLLRKQQTINKKIKNKTQQAAGIVVNNNAVSNINKKEINKKLYTALNTLPITRRQVFEMNRLNGMSYKEIALQLSITEKAVENHIYKASRQVRQHLSKEYLTCFFIFYVTFYC